MFSKRHAHAALKRALGIDVDKRAPNDCFSLNPTKNLTDRMNIALNSTGKGFVLSLCPNTVYPITSQINFNSANQEISTAGYPTDNSRAILLVSGPNTTTKGHTTAISGNCGNCEGVAIRNIQINGNRNGGTIIDGGANIELGGDNSGQLVEYVHSFDPRGWSCLHIAEGPLSCSGVTVQHNDIGPCGTDLFQQWADGISYACLNGHIRNNTVTGPTDGGIVLFGAPGTLVENNTIIVGENTLLGGINLVDVNPWNGDYTNTTVQNNVIEGGFANNPDGDATFDVIIKIGIAMGPRTWFGDKYAANVSRGAIVRNNRLTGAFGYAMAMSGVVNFTVQDNALFGNTTFIGSRGPNCSDSDKTPTPEPFLLDPNFVRSSKVQSEFVNVTDGDSLTCILPPDDGDFWPWEGTAPQTTTVSAGAPTSSADSGSGSPSSDVSKTNGVALGFGILGAVVVIAVVSWFVYKRAKTVTKEQKESEGYIRY